MIFSKRIKRKNLYSEYVKWLNVILGLSGRELDILAILIKLDINWPIDKVKNIINKSCRSYIMRETLVNKNNLSRYIRKFKEKKILVNIDNNWVINYDYIIAPLTVNKNNVNIILVLNIDE